MIQSRTSLLLLASLIPFRGAAEPSGIPLGTRWIPAPDHRLASYFVLSFQTPSHHSGHYVRLSIPGLPSGARLWLDAVPLLPVEGASEEWLIPNLPPPDSIARIAVAAPSIPGPAALILSHRVHVSRFDAAACPGRFTATVWVRNTLDNTVNVSVSLFIKGQSLSASSNATVPPGFTQSILLRIQHAARAGQTLEVTDILEKAEEAMEPAYTVTGVRTFSVLDVGAPACR